MKKILYQYTIKTDGTQAFLIEKGFRIPIWALDGDAESQPKIAAELLRRLATWANEQADIIDEMESFN